MARDSDGAFRQFADDLLHDDDFLRDLAGALQPYLSTTPHRGRGRPPRESLSGEDGALSANRLHVNEVMEQLTVREFAAPLIGTVF